MEWPREALRACDNCQLSFHSIPAFVVVPARRFSHAGLYGNYCSWNCAKRGLMDIQPRNWFALMSIVAMRSGAKLPIVPSKKQRPPHKRQKQFPLKPVDGLFLIPVRVYITYIPMTTEPSNAEDDEPPPTTFSSIIHSTL